jgi:hypothetical protein
MAQSQNQFSQSVEKGIVDLRFSGITIPCQVASDEAAALVPGQLVKMVDVAGSVPRVTALAADTEIIFGAVAYNIKDVNFPLDKYLEIVSVGSVIYMEASAAIARGGLVMPVIAGQKVATATSGKSILGLALDKAAADGDIIRVLIGFNQAAVA